MSVKNPGLCCLVLTRREGQEIELRTIDGTSIIVRLVSIKGDRARLAVEAPQSVAIHRREVWEQIEAQGRKVSA